MSTRKVLEYTLANKETSELLDSLSIAERSSEIRKRISEKGIDTPEYFRNKFEELLTCLNNKFVVTK